MTVTDGARAAIIGAGLMGRWHADAVRKIGGRVTVIVDPSEVARAALGRRHPEARLLAELDPVMVSRLATVSHVCTPLSTHAPILEALIGVGVHVLVEKPFAESAESTGRLLSLAEAHHVVVCPVHQLLFQDGVLDLLGWRTIIAPLRRIEFSTCSAGAAGNDPASLNDLIAEILPHPLALASAMVRAPMARVSWQVTSPSPGEFFALATVGEAVVTAAISAHGRPTENVLRVVGDGGSAYADLFHGYAVRHGGTLSRRAKITRPFVNAATTLNRASANLVRRAARREPAYPGLRELIARFYSATRGERSAPISAAEALDVAIARDQLLACLRSLPRPA